MKLQNFFRTSAIALGFSAALLFAGVAHAQEIDNPSFAQGANSAPMTYGQSASTANAANVNSGAAALNLNAANAQAAPMAAQATVLSDETSLRGMGLGMLAIGLAWAVLYARTRRNERNGEGGRLTPEVRYMAKVYSLK